MKQKPSEKRSYYRSHRVNVYKDRIWNKVWKGIAKRQEKRS